MGRAEFTGSSSRAGSQITQVHPNNPQSKQNIGLLITLQNKAYPKVIGNAKPDTTLKQQV